MRNNTDSRKVIARSWLPNDFKSPRFNKGGAPRQCRPSRHTLLREWEKGLAKSCMARKVGLAHIVGFEVEGCQLRSYSAAMGIDVDL